MGSQKSWDTAECVYPCMHARAHTHARHTTQSSREWLFIGGSALMCIVD